MYCGVVDVVASVCVTATHGGNMLMLMDAGIAAGIGKNILLTADDESTCRKKNYFCVPSLKHSEIYL